jgi:uncharacterized protein YggE
MTVTLPDRRRQQYSIGDRRRTCSEPLVAGHSRSCSWSSDLLSSRGRSRRRPAAGPRTISVTGHGEVTASPDRVALSFTVETTGVRAAAAAAENAKRSSAVIDAVKAFLGADDTTTTTRYMIEPRYEAPSAGSAREPHITGYLVRNEVQVESRRLDKVSALIDAAIGAGANRISGLRFSLSNVPSFFAALSRRPAPTRAPRPRARPPGSAFD